MPPASVCCTPEWRMASSRDVLPWSTWPMTVTTGGRGLRSDSSSWNVNCISSSGEMILISRPRSPATSSTRSSLIDCVNVSGVPSKNRRLTISLPGTSRTSASSPTVMPLVTVTVPTATPSASAFFAASSAAFFAASALRCSLRFLRRPVDCFSASATAARASSSTLLRSRRSASCAIWR